MKVDLNEIKGGQWGWYLNSAANGDDSQWKNGEDGFGTGCTTYPETESCTGYGTDFAFALIP